jgi:hypothetical protein
MGVRLLCHGSPEKPTSHAVWVLHHQRNRSLNGTAAPTVAKKTMQGGGGPLQTFSWEMLVTMRDATAAKWGNLAHRHSSNNMPSPALQMAAWRATRHRQRHRGMTRGGAADSTHVHAPTHMHTHTYTHTHIHTYTYTHTHAHTYTHTHTHIHIHTYTCTHIDT